MTSAQIITALLAVVGGAVASIITGFFGMPQMKAGAKTTAATGEVSISGDAREWAKTFAERADKADARAEAAEHEVEECNKRCDVLETRLDNWQAYARRMQRELEKQGIAVPPPPE